MPEIIYTERDNTSHRNNFRINDIIFTVPPENIAIDEIEQTHQWKVLRSRHPTKIPSGKADTIILTKFTVLPEEMWKLHRLIIEFKYTPFWQIDNEVVRDQLMPGLPYHYSMGVCAASLQGTTIPNEPGSLEVSLTMYWFNYFPFTRNLMFKQDWYADKETGRRTIHDIPVPTEGESGIDFDGDGFIDELGSQFDEGGNSGSVLNKYQDYGISPEAFSEGAVDLGDLAPKLWKDPYVSPVDANESNIYVTYINHLQATAIEQDYHIGGSLEKVLSGESYSDEGKITPLPYNLWGATSPHLRFSFREFGVYEPSSEKWNDFVSKFNENTEVENLVTDLINYGDYTQIEQLILAAYPKAQPIIKELITLSVEVGTNPIWMAHLINMESAGTWSPSKQNPSSTQATGFIQITKSTAIGLGTTVDQLKVMSAQEQWLWVRKYFLQPHHKKHFPLDTEQKLYLLVFHPDGINNGLDQDLGFSQHTIDINAGIRTPRGYIDLVHQYAHPVGQMPELPEAELETPLIDNTIPVEDDNDELLSLLEAGWVPYLSPHVANVFYRNHDFFISGNLNDPIQSGCLLTSQGFHITNHFAKIPLIGWEHPTYQYLGGQDTRFYFSFASMNKASPDHMSSDAKKLFELRDILQRNANLFRIIPGSWAAQTDWMSGDLVGVEELVFNRVRSESVPGSPGLYTIDIEAEVAGPLVVEDIERDGSEYIEELYGEVTKELIKHITVYQLRGEMFSDVDKTILVPAHWQSIISPIQTETGISSSFGLQFDKYQITKISGGVAEIIVTTDPMEWIVNEIGGKLAELHYGWDSIVVNNIDPVEDDEKLHTAVELLCIAIRTFNVTLSDERYGGLSLEEIQSQELLGIEGLVMPVWESHDVALGSFDYWSPVKIYLGQETYIDIDDSTNLAARAGNTRISYSKYIDDLQNLYAELVRYKRKLTPVGFALSAAEFTFSFFTLFLKAIYTDELRSWSELKEDAQKKHWAYKEKELENINLLKEHVLYPTLQKIYGERLLHNNPLFIQLLNDFNKKNMLRRGTCYPDLPLPPHPYFDNDIYTDPDFYFYNDAELDGAEDVEQGEDAVWRQQTKTIIGKALRSYEGMKKGHDEWPKPTKQIEEIDDVGEYQPGHWHNYQSEQDGSSSGVTSSKNQDKQIIYEGDQLKERQEAFNEMFADPAGHMSLRNLDEGGIAFPELKIDHGFDQESLEKIAFESAQDIQKYKLCMRRAFPSFRLEFIQEPNEQVLWHIHSRAHGYAAVLEATITRNKYVPADLAVVTLQNLSGVLDGGLIGAITDLDYDTYPGSYEEAQGEKQKTLDEFRSAINEGTPLEDYFNSIVVRPGIGIRLSLGYSNDSRKLGTRFVGKVVEVVPRDNSDSITLVCQSYGVELTQVQKGIIGLNADDGGDTIQKKFGIKDPTLSWAKGYNNTYELLSALLNAPEILHFGRKELKMDFLPGESLDSRYDTKEYEHGWKWKSLLKWISGDVNGAIAEDMYSKGDGSIEKTMATALGFGEIFKDYSDEDIKAPWWLGWSGGLSTLYTAVAKTKHIYNFMIGKKITPLTNNPADDNIFVPYPGDYVDYGWDDPTGGITDKEIPYHLYRTTTWDVIQEMTLRHPGWIAAPQHYGSRMTLFFGVPSQRYWAAPMDKRFAQEIKDKAESFRLHSDMLATNPASSFLREEIKADLEILEPAYNLRFRPFRRYHLLTSKHDIIANNITASSRNTFNSVAVRYNEKGIDTKEKNQKMLKHLNDRAKDTYLVKVNASLRDQDVALENIYYPNCNGHALAHRYGVGSLCRGLGAMYTGQLVALSTSEIKPNDIVFIVDTYNDMAGPIVVKEVTTTISPDTGMIDVIVPEAMVVTNEESSKVIFDGLRVSIMKKAAVILNSPAYNDLSLIGQALNPATQASLVGQATNPIGSAGLGANIAGVIMGGIEFYMFTKKKNAVIVIPLHKNGEPMVAGIPEDLIDSPVHNLYGDIKLLIEDIQKGHLQRITEAKTYAFNVFDVKDGTLGNIINAAAARNVSGQ